MRQKNNLAPSTLKTQLDKVFQENIYLRQQLLQATDKQHQEMSRAIYLKEKNIKLAKQLQKINLERCELKNLLSSNIQSC